MTSLPARVWRAFTSAVADTTDSTKVGSAKWNADLEVFLGTVCNALMGLNVDADQVPYFTSASAADVTTLSAFGRLVIASADNAAARTLLATVNLAGDTMSGDLNMGGTNKVTGLATPTASTDAANKAYVDALATLVSGALVFKGAWDASAGTFPGGGTAALGAFYKVSVAGTVNGQSVSVGDDIFALVNNASTSTYASNWLVIQGTLTLAEIQAAVGFTFGSLASASSITASLISDASANGRSLITAASYAAMRTLLGLAAVAASGAYSDLTGTPTLGTAAAFDVGTAANKVVQLDGSAKLPAVDGSQLTNLPTGALQDIDRRNLLLERIYQAKNSGLMRRLLSSAADGFSGTDGINAGSSSGYFQDPTNKLIQPSGGGTMVSAGTGTIIGDMTFNGGTAAAFDGNTNQATAAAAAKSTDNGYVGKNWGSGNSKIITGYTLYSCNDHGFSVDNASGAITVKLRGSNDGSTWTTLHTDTFNNSASLITKTYTSGINISTAYQYHSVLLTTGSDCQLGECQFFTGLNNATIITAAQTADASVSNARVLLEIDNSATPTLNTDLTVDVTCDGGTHWTAATLSSIGIGQSGRLVLETVDQACTAGTSFAARIKTLNNKNIPIYGVTLTVH
jgi:hypothetical protein